MDNLVRLPGTNFRIGLDPLIGLLPGVGDTGSAFISALALLQAVRRGLPKIVLARMSLNILINQLIGIIPVAGDAFSFWFKSNARNHELIKEHMHAPRLSRRADWIFVIAVLAVMFALVGAGIFLSLLFLDGLVKLLSGR